MSQSPEKPFARSCAQNGPHILALLKARFPAEGHLLEIGSGTGQHAVMFAPELPGIRWQTSDLPHRHAGMTLWLDEANHPNIAPPLILDVANSSEWPQQRFDLVYSANTLHIMPEPAIAAMFANLPAVMQPEAACYLYGPFRYGDQHTSESNRTFDNTLRDADPAQGVRDIHWLKRLGAESGLHLAEDISMPGNNRLLIWRPDNG